jgi:hypothetical protein
VAVLEEVVLEEDLVEVVEKVALGVVFIYYYV